MDYKYFNNGDLVWFCGVVLTWNHKIHAHLIDSCVAYQHQDQDYYKNCKSAGCECQHNQ